MDAETVIRECEPGRKPAPLSIMGVEPAVAQHRAPVGVRQPDRLPAPAQHRLETAGQRQDQDQIATALAVTRRRRRQGEALLETQWPVEVPFGERRRRTVAPSATAVFDPVAVDMHPRRRYRADVLAIAITEEDHAQTPRLGLSGTQRDALGAEVDDETVRRIGRPVDGRRKGSARR